MIMKNYDDMEWDEFSTMLEGIEKLCGIPAENTGGSTMCFIKRLDENREIIFGYANGSLGFSCWDYETGRPFSIGGGDMVSECASIEEQADYIKEVIKRIKQDI